MSIMGHDVPTKTAKWKSWPGKALLASLALISVTIGSSALAKDKNTKLKTDNQSIGAPMDESKQKSTNLKQLRGMQPVNKNMQNGQSK